MHSTPTKPIHRFLLLVGLACLAAVAATAAAEPDAGPPVELIVRLAPAPDAPAPETLVSALAGGPPLPTAIDLGAPLGARLVIPERDRATGESRARLLAEPDHPRSRLERYVVLIYPPGSDARELLVALRANPAIEWAGENHRAELSVEPNDPLFPPFPGAEPFEYQWGSYSLDLTSAWDYARGHAYVGVVDTGIDVDHEDLRGFYRVGGNPVWDGGNFRPHLSWDYGYERPEVDEGEPGLDQYNCPRETVDIAGHGTHVAGIVGATPNNDKGVAGACWNCSLLVMKASRLLVAPNPLDPCSERPVANFDVKKDWVCAAMVGAVDRGSQLITMSLGYRPGNYTPCDQDNDPDDPICVALELAERRDLAVVAASGNNGTATIDFPANDDRVLAAGGLDPSGALWDDCPGSECGSNRDPNQFLIPAKQVLSTFYKGISYQPGIDCDDSVLPPDGDGYGPCTGTSMSAPYLAALVGIVRSINPLLSADDIRRLLELNLVLPPGWTPDQGQGEPDALGSVFTAFGAANGGALLPNRLTPLFSLYGASAEDWFYTSVPQVGSAFQFVPGGYANQGPDVPGYGIFPGAECIFSPCPPDPAASVYVFTSDREPFPGAPGLVPLYRMSYTGATPTNPDNRDHVYTTEAAGILAYGGVGYELDGIEGYIFERCTPEPACIPPGAERLYRRYNAARDDHAIFPESELAAMEADGYTQSSGNDWIGYAYPNADADSDDLIDGFEALIGTDPNEYDSDCDGVSDGDEALVFGANGYRDPLDGGCAMGETGKVTVDHNGLTVVLNRSYQNPVVFAQPASFFGGQPAAVRILDVQSDRFTLALIEPPNLDGTHVLEKVSYLVLEAGAWTLPDGRRLEVGEATTSATVGRRMTNVWYGVTFAETLPAEPVVISQVQTDNDPHWVKTRHYAASSSGFALGMEEDEAQTTQHATETLGWLAIEPGTGTWSGHLYEAALTPNSIVHTMTQVPFTQSFTTNPNLVASLATYHGGDQAGIRYHYLSPAEVYFKAEEDTTFDSETSHIAEVVGFLAVEGSGTLSATPR